MQCVFLCVHHHLPGLRVYPVIVSYFIGSSLGDIETKPVALSTVERQAFLASNVFMQILLHTKLPTSGKNLLP